MIDEKQLQATLVSMIKSLEEMAKMIYFTKPEYGDQPSGVAFHNFKNHISDAEKSVEKLIDH